MQETIFALWEAMRGGGPNTAARKILNDELEYHRRLGQEEGGAEIAKLRAEIHRLNEKWRDYEQNYILPTFDWAAAMGFDLRKAVHDNPGKNCVVLFFDTLRARVWKLEEYVEHHEDCPVPRLFPDSPNNPDWRPACTCGLADLLNREPGP